MFTKRPVIAAFAIGLGGLAVPAASAQAAEPPAPPIHQALHRVERVSVTPDGSQTIGISQVKVPISGKGRFVAYASTATDIVAGDTNDRSDVFLRDRLTDTTVRVSLGPHGQQLTADSLDSVMSPSGRFVATTLLRSKLHMSRIYVYDQLIDASRLALKIPYTDPDHSGFYPTATGISSDGRFVVLDSPTRLLPRDRKGTASVYVRDRRLRRTSLVSQTTAGVDMGDTGGGSISADGRYVVFQAGGSVYLRDRVAHRTTLVPHSVTGRPDGRRYSGDGSISADGRYITFTSSARDLVRGDTNNELDVFVRDRVTHTTVLASLGAHGQLGRDLSERSSVSGHGRFVTFVSEARNLVSGDTNRKPDVFVRDLLRRTTRLAFPGYHGQPADGWVWYPQISANGRYVATASDATNLVVGDTNDNYDAFVRDVSR